MGRHPDNARVIPAAIVRQMAFKRDPAVTGANHIHGSYSIGDSVKMRRKGSITVYRPHKFRNMVWAAMHHNIAFIEMFKDDTIG